MPRHNDLVSLTTFAKSCAASAEDVLRQGTQIFRPAATRGSRRFREAIQGSPRGHGPPAEHGASLPFANGRTNRSRSVEYRADCRPPAGTWPPKNSTRSFQVPGFEPVLSSAARYFPSPHQHQPQIETLASAFGQSVDEDIVPFVKFVSSCRRFTKLDRQSLADCFRAHGREGRRQ